jgi:hypothetical protein
MALEIKSLAILFYVGKYLLRVFNKHSMIHQPDIYQEWIFPICKGMAQFDCGFACERVGVGILP